MAARILFLKLESDCITPWSWKPFIILIKKTQQFYKIQPNSKDKFRLGMWYMSVTLVLKRLKQKDYKMSFRLSWATEWQLKQVREEKREGMRKRKERKGKAFGRIGVVFISSHKFLVVKWVKQKQNLLLQWVVILGAAGWLTSWFPDSGFAML